MTYCHTDHRREKVCNFKQHLLVYIFADIDYREGIQKAHFQMKFFVEEVRSIRYNTAAAGNKERFRTVAVKHTAPGIYGTIDFPVQTGHNVTRNLGNCGSHFAVRIFVRTAESHKTVFAFHFFGIFKADIELFGDLLGDGVTTDRNGAGKHPVAIHNNKVGAASAHIQDHIASFFAEHIGAGGIVHRRR